MAYNDLLNTPTSSVAVSRQAREALQLQRFMDTAVQRDPTNQVTCRVGDSSCAAAHASALGPSDRVARSGVEGSLLHLQRQYGNRHVRNVLSEKIQTKLTVSQPGDKDEVEAEQASRAVMLKEQQATPELQRQPEQSKEEEEKKKLKMQRDPSAVARQEEKPEEEQPQ